MSLKRIALGACSFLGIALLGATSVWTLGWPNAHLIEYGLCYWWGASALVVFGYVGLLVLNERER